MLTLGFSMVALSRYESIVSCTLYADMQTVNFHEVLILVENFIFDPVL